MPKTDSPSALLALLTERFGGSRSRADQVRSLLPTSIPADWRAVAAQLAVSLGAAIAARNAPTPFILGLSGGQGAGKSTLARALVAAFGHCGIRAACLSLDDVYLTASHRAQRARQVHPLLRTRGVPGTHDLPLLYETLAQLSQPVVALPVFDKANDDRQARDTWPRVAGPVEVLVLEGWCVGASAQPDAELDVPVNDFERQADADGRYRQYVNAQLANDYLPLWDCLHAWLFVAVPDLAAVRRWRTQQELQLPVGQRMSAAAIERFVAHYERLTLWLLQSAPGQATWTLELDENHTLRH